MRAKETALTLIGEASRARASASTTILRGATEIKVLGLLLTKVFSLG